ncbi:MAG: hypothetical protein WAQ53_08465 [Thiofilum sp.]|uniref:hypothetical protein n=1 Tax=Thiofilum sp. TaxID=2212733 RepID=UPI0025F603A8|nr:hypothetical protein [Thiofilum sp.]MBK8452863.1 hypothetical protein [Thiofilum sp.]
MKLTTITIMSLLAFSLSTAWANEDLEAVPASEEIQILASINDATAAQVGTQLAANEVDTIEIPAEETTTEAAPADEEMVVSEEVMQVCENAAQEEGVTEEAMEAFMQNCIDENSGTLVEESEVESSAADTMTEDEMVADEAGVADLSQPEMATEEVIEDEGMQTVADEGAAVDDPNAYVMTGSEGTEEVAQ